MDVERGSGKRGEGKGRAGDTEEGEGGCSLRGEGLTS